MTKQKVWLPYECTACNKRFSNRWGAVAHWDKRGGGKCPDPKIQIRRTP